MFFRYLSAVAFVVGLMLVAGCAAPRPVAQPAPVAAGYEARTAVHPALLLPVPSSPGFEEAVRQGTRTREGRPGARYWQQTARYALTARLFPEAQRLEGAGRVVYHNHAPDTLYLVAFELAQNFHRAETPRLEPAEITGGVTLGRVAVDGRAATENAGSPRYDVEGTGLFVTLDEPLGPGDSVVVEIDWSFRVPHQGVGERMGADGDDLYFLAYWYPALRVYDDVAGWHTDPFLGQGEFYQGFADYDVTIEAPAGWVVAATGALENPADVLADATRARLARAARSDTPVTIAAPGEKGITRAAERLRWRFHAPRVRDFTFSATRDGHWDAARTPVGDRDGDGRPDSALVQSFYRDAATRWRHTTRYQQQAIAFLSAYTGFPYPWPHMTAVEGAGIIGGGMEFPMMTLMSDYGFAGDDALYQVTAHELAHMWIPMIVGTDERRYGWMDEGSTTFAENQARRAFFGDDDEGEMMDQLSYVNIARQGLEGEIMRWSNFHYHTLAYQTASYPKPSTLLATLRALLGEETFLRAYRGFIRDWAFRHPYPADFFNAFEREAGRDLDWFWRSFYFETWTFDQALASVTPRAGGVDLVVESLGLAPLPARVTVTTTTGETLHREIPVDVWLRGDTRAALSVDTPAPVARVELDPDFAFPDVDRRNNRWQR